MAEVDVEGKYVRLKNNSETARLMFSVFNIKCFQYIVVEHLIVLHELSCVREEIQDVPQEIIVNYKVSS